MPAERYPVKSLFPLPSGTPLDLPQLQHQFGPETEEAKSKRLERLAAVKSSFVHTWEGYKKDAWMRDELAPVTGGYITSFGGWAATLVDSLDTLWIMGFHQDFEFAVHDLSQIDFWTTESSTINVFETTIRYLGGFLGAYDLSDGQYPALLSKATELGEMLYLAFDTPNRMPVTRWDWNAARTGKKQEAGEDSLIAEVGSLTLEFTRLSQLTGDPKYYDAIQRITNEFEKSQSQTLIPGLWPVLVNAKFLTFKDTGFTLGGMADSLYEYLPKQYMLQGGLTDQYKKLYVTSMTAIKKYIFFRPMVPDNADILISGSARAQSDKKVSLDPRGQHLGCFTGGMVGIGAKLFESPDDLKVARKLVDGCIWAYDSMATGIMPEVFYMVPCDDATHCEWDEQKWHHALTVRQRDDDKSAAMPPEDRLKYMIQNRRLPPGYSDIADKRYILRPEAIESVFILYRLTGDPTLQDAAWRMFNAIEKATRTELANAAIEDVTIEGSKKDNRMESFWLAETLKYFFLIFSEPGVVSLDEYVL
ncbi:hypothetical protein MMC12_000145 [Toensbergia leucococca]|nr:hypothetical protein [Toensbergia leucococca]